MATTLDRVAEDIRERAEHVRRELAERERAYRAETQQLRDELARLDGALRAMSEDAEPAEGTARRSSAPRAPRGENRAKVLGVIAERSGVSAAEIAQATGIASATVYSTLAKLTQADEVVKEQLPSGTVGYRLPDPQQPAA
jgi:CRP-like cAMP-binding protein